MVGTFYAAPAPGAEPFVAVGSEVAEETQVCILEVMKLMNAVVAGVRGVVAEVCVENGAAVQFGETLFRVRPAMTADRAGRHDGAGRAPEPVERERPDDADARRDRAR